MQETQQWARPDVDGFAVEIIDFDPTGLFHDDIHFYPVQPELVGWIDDKCQWNGEYWDIPDPDYIRNKKLKAAETDFSERVQQRLDNFALTRGYDDILSATTYATSTNPTFAAEGQYAVEARDETWAKAFELLAGYLAKGEFPEWTETAKELPRLAWPG
jgi:hypothetical protein